MDETYLTLNKPAQKEMSKPISLPAKQEPAVKHKILIIDDDEDVRRYLKQILELQGYDVFEAWYSAQAEAKVQEHGPSLVLLDLDLGNGQSGINLCSKIRSMENGKLLKIIILTGMKDRQNFLEVTVLECGADAYLTKPVIPSKLIAHVNAQLKNHSSLNGDNKLGGTSFSVTENKDNSHRIEKCGFSVGPRRNQIFYGDKPVENLTQTEFKILELMLKSHPAKVTREMFREEVWNNLAFVTFHTISSHINRLKKKLPASAATRIVCEAKQGYKITD